MTIKKEQEFAKLENDRYLLETGLDNKLIKAKDDEIKSFK